MNSSYLDPNLEIEKVGPTAITEIHIIQKAGYDFSFSIVNFPFITSNIPAF
jgi:hypothetical protein